MSETEDENKPSQMVRVPTPLIPAVRELSRLHRQGRTSEVLQGLDELILALDSSSSTNNATSQTIGAIYERLDNLESQLLGESNSNETDSTKRLASLEQKIDFITTRMAQFADAIIQIQNNLNNQPRRNKSHYNNSYYTGQTTRIQPLTEENLAKRLGVNVETVRFERSSQPPPLFVGWSKRKDSSGIGWEFNTDTGLYHPVT
jgi:septal ring factor EnvC (AmiA/AmiB activator)